jgi:DNA-directed RNA polymerase subunit F
VDVVLAGPGIEELSFEGAIEIEIEGLTVPVARTEDIVVMKILSGRPKDLEDVAAILAARRTSLDEQRVRELLGMLEQALDQSDLLPTFERHRARATRGG